MVDSQTGYNGTEVSFDFTSDSVVAGDVGTYSFTVSVGDVPAVEEEYNVDVAAYLIVGGEVNDSISDSTEVTATENDTINGTLSHEFETSPQTNRGNTRTVEPIWVGVTTDFWTDAVAGASRDGPDGSGGSYSFGPFVDALEATTASVSTDVTPEPEEVLDFGDDGAGTQGADIGSAYNQTTPFRIESIEYEADGPISLFPNAVTQQGSDEFTVPLIDFEYTNPTIAIDSAGRFAKHQIIGGKTVRQKIGEDPLNVSINGVCDEETANKIDTLRDAKFGTIYSTRLPNEGDSLRVQFGSASTEPMEEGGAADMKSGELLYSYNLNCIEVLR